MVTWNAGRVSTEDSVETPRAFTGEQLRDRYWTAVGRLTFGLMRRRGNSVACGPVELLRFGAPRVEANRVEWPIEGGLLSAAGGGRWTIAMAPGGTVVARVDGFRPSLPRPVYALTHLQVHLLFTRLFLLELRGRDAPPGIPVPREDRLRAATIDVALCLTAGRLLGMRLRPRAVLGLIAGYHLACWAISGRTLGGAAMGQRVASIDGRRPTFQQSALRLVASPLSWMLRRPVHDEIAGTSVIVDEKEEGAAKAAP